MEPKEFRSSQSALIAELQLLMMDVSESGLDSDTVELLVEKADDLIGLVAESAREEQLDRVRTDLGRVQNVFHQAKKRTSRADPEGPSSGPGPRQPTL